MTTPLSGIHGKTLPHSELLREGIARTLALIHNQCEDATRRRLPEGVMHRVFAQNPGWEIWATLG